MQCHAGTNLGPCIELCDHGGWDRGVLRAAQLHGMPEMVTGLAFTCDARALVAAGSDAALRMWDLTSGRVRHTLTGHVAKVRRVPQTRVSGLARGM